ncbi:MAG: peptide-binding protein [Candidatus Omnitrophica bacterium]|nr:peptide-binding protein [Candidatus Omnitrophota bacterium]MDD5078897.1 peptide-binding protein [Candidatus Omnitrophota bacterium]
MGNVIPKNIVIIRKLPIILVAFLFVLLAGLAFGQDRGDAVVSASIADARNLLPMLASDSSSSEVSGMIFNGLVKYDKDLNLTGDLAQSWEVLEGGLVIIFHLRKNIVWQDGVPFTAADVEFTYNKMIDPQVRTPYGGDFERVKSLEVLDDHNIKVTYKEPFVPGLASWGMSIIPKHLLEKEDLNDTKFSRNPVGTGPYKLKSWKPQEKIELTANPRYFEHQPYIDRAITRVIPDESTIFLELQTQGVDSSGLSPLQYSRQTDSEFFIKYYRKFRLPGFNYTYLGYNLRDSRFSDKRIRQALNYAVDKKEIIDMVLLGFGNIATGPYVQQSWAYNRSVSPVPFDPKKAKQLLKQAGWADSERSGWLEKNGRIFEFTIVTNQGNEERLKVAEIIQRRLKDIGIRVKIKVVEWSVFLSEVIDKKNFEAILLGWSVPREPDNFDIWHSSKTREGEFNFIGYKNEEVDKLLLEGRRTFDQQERRKIYNRIHTIIYDEQPYMFLFTSESLSILHKRFQGIKPAPAGIGYNFIDWWVKTADQKYRIIK